MDAYWHRKKSFKGEFDGNGKTISGLYINGNTNCVGLFGHVGKYGTVIGTVKNVTVTDFYVSGSYYVGGICGRNDVGTLEGCTSGCTVNGTTNSAGGICGYNKGGSVLNCHNTGKVTGSIYVGGVWGKNNRTVSNCYYLSATSGTDSNEPNAKTKEQFVSGEVAYLLQKALDDAASSGQNCPAGLGAEDQHGQKPCA